MTPNGAFWRGRQFFDARVTNVKTLNVCWVFIVFTSLSSAVMSQEPETAWKKMLSQWRGFHVGDDVMFFWRRLQLFWRQRQNLTWRPIGVRQKTVQTIPWRRQKKADAVTNVKTPWISQQTVPGYWDITLVQSPCSVRSSLFCFFASRFYSVCRRQWADWAGCPQYFTPDKGFHTGTLFWRWRQKFWRAGVKFNMTPNGEHQENGPAHCWCCVKSLKPRHLCENPWKVLSLWVKIENRTTGPERIKAWQVVSPQAQHSH